MAVNKLQGFFIDGSEPVDTRLVLTKSEMKDAGIVSFNLPDVYFAICKGSSDTDDDPDIGKLFVYNKNNEFDEVTGKFRLYNNQDEQVEVTYHTKSCCLEMQGIKYNVKND